ncbi:hypothetical protein FE783_04345 [Paenibacillus mesophilus]|uniref:hypothetical protein n=1 Tax=Paenibacillus mesophilus TaxID=2582849 RepID=UPI00110EFC0D|nr:hypothetical protein [Paenibacillus mesophilus]TMV52180.1 hypothetical protein FE783_04345 [Paenibacillus mesophilus]
MQKPILQTYPRLALFSEENYRGRESVVRGSAGIRSLEARFGDVESLRFFSTNPNATLVLFSRSNCKGLFRVFRGNRNIADLRDFIGGNNVESLISSNVRLTLEQIRRIRRTGELPAGFRNL